MTSKNGALLVVAMVSIFTTIFSFVVGTTFYDAGAPVFYTALASGVTGIGIIGLIFVFCKVI